MSIKIISQSEQCADISVISDWNIAIRVHEIVMDASDTSIKQFFIWVHSGYVHVKGKVQNVTHRDIINRNLKGIEGTKGIICQLELCRNTDNILQRIS